MTKVQINSQGKVYAANGKALLVQEGSTPSGTLNITQNGIYDVTNYASADVSVSGGGQTPPYQGTAIMLISEENLAGATMTYEDDENLALTYTITNSIWSQGYYCTSIVISESTIDLDIIQSATVNIVTQDGRQGDGMNMMGNDGQIYASTCSFFVGIPAA